MTVQPESSGEPIEVRRNAGLLVLVAFGSLAMAAAYGWRASQESGAMLWVVVTALVVIGALHLVAWLDARTPLLVADEHGVRLRDGREWRGFTWASIDRVELEPRKGFLRDGRIVVVPEDDADDLTLPMGLATTARAEEVVRRLTAFAKDRTLVSVRVAHPGETPAADPESLAPGWVPAAVPDLPDDSDELDDDAGADDFDVADGLDADERDGDSRGTPDSDIDDIPVARPAAMAADVVRDYPDEAPRRPEPIRPVPALGGPGRAVRADITRTSPASIGMLALEHQVTELPEARELRGTEGRVGLVIEPAPVIEEPAAPAVVEIEHPEPEAEPASEPESEPEAPPLGERLREAREHLGVSIDAAAERTRIRPHVIEAIEASDFEPCGGDFYARGHLRSLARILGLDGDELVRDYDATYAHAPIEARKVFEAELATGPKPSIRLTSGGPNWAALIGVVLVLAIIWGAAQYFTGDDDSGSGSAAAAPITPPEPKGNDGLKQLGAPTVNDVSLTGRGDGSRIVVRTADGTVSWRGRLAGGESKQLDVPGKVTVEVERGAPVRASVNGEKPELVGAPGTKDSAVLGKP